MERIHFAMLATIIMTMLIVGNAHSGPGMVLGKKNEDSVPTPAPQTEQKEEYTISEYEPMELTITCGGDANIADGERFKIILNGEAFMDRATCLVWEMYPLNFYSEDAGLTLTETLYRCNGLETGGRNDWRVPNVFELMFLEDSIDGSLRPWDIDPQCYSTNKYTGGEFKCRGWTGTPAIGGPEGSYYVITLNHGSLSWKHFNDKAYPFCVRGVMANSGN